MGVFTINLMSFPIKLENMCIGVFELANKKWGSEFTNLDERLARIVAVGLAKGLVSDEIRVNMAKETT